MKAKLLIPAIASMLLAAPALMAANAGAYIGASIGPSKTKDGPDVSEFDAYLLANGVTATSSTDDTDNAWKLFGGYKFNRYFTIEGSYADLGKFSINSTLATGTHETTIELQAVAIAAVAILPLTYNFELFGKAGGQYWDADHSSTPLGEGSRSDQSSDVMFGLGAGYNLNDNFGLRVEWELYNDIGEHVSLDKSDVEMWSAGLQYNF